MSVQIIFFLFFFLFVFNFGLSNNENSKTSRMYNLVYQWCWSQTFWGKYGLKALPPHWGAHGWGWGCGWSHSPSRVLLLPLPSPCPSTGHFPGCSPSARTCAAWAAGTAPWDKQESNRWLRQKIVLGLERNFSISKPLAFTVLGMDLEDSCNSIFVVWFGDSQFCQSHVSPGTVCRSQGRSSCIISWSQSTTASDSFQGFHFDIYLAHAVFPLTHFWSLLERNTGHQKCL